MVNEEHTLEGFHSWLRRYGRGESTADTYVNNVKRAFSQYDDPLEKLVEDQSPKYLRVIRSSLRAWAEFVEDEDFTKELKKIRLPPARRVKEEPALTKKQWNRLRAEINDADYISDPVRGELGMLVNRGFRCGDVLRLKSSEVKEALRSGVLSYEAKGRRRLFFTVASSWREYLEIFADFKHWNRVEDLISPYAHEDTRKKSAGKAISRALGQCGGRIGIAPENMHPHLLRATYSTLYYRICQDPVKLQAHMQWASIETAMGYVQADDREELDSIAESLFQ